jgi:hypothetical protein
MKIPKAYDVISRGNCPRGFMSFDRHCFLCKYSSSPDGIEPIEERMRCYHKGKMQPGLFDRVEFQEVLPWSGK